MRLNKALGNDEVTFQRQTVDAESRAGGQLADITHLLRLEGVVDHDPLAGHDIGTEAVQQFLLGGGAVKAGGDQNGDGGVRLTLADLLQQNGHGDAGGHTAGVVRGDDQDILLALRQSGQGRRPDRGCQGVADDVGFRTVRMEFLRMVHQNVL